MLFGLWIQQKLSISVYYKPDLSLLRQMPEKEQNQYYPECPPAFSITYRKKDKCGGQKVKKDADQSQSAKYIPCFPALFRSV